MKFPASIYIVNFNDDVRKQKMIQRFTQFDLSFEFVQPVMMTDERLCKIDETIKCEKRTWAIMLQHLDSLRHFLETTTDAYCIVCEDDILISKDFRTDFAEIILDFEKMHLDLLLLGYLLPFRINNDSGNSYFTKKNKYSYYDYPGDMWGSQMYMVSRKHAEYLLNTYTIDYAIRNLNNPPFSPDWILTKVGNKAMIYPMIAVEEGNTKTDNIGQNDFHRRCFENNYEATIHL